MSFLGRFGQSGLQRKKIQTAISMLLLSLLFYVFMVKMNEKNRLTVHCSVCAKKFLGCIFLEGAVCNNIEVGKKPLVPALW